MTFSPPQSDILFALTAQAGFDRLIASGAFPDCDLDLVSAVLAAAGDFAQGVLAPLNHPGDVAGARLENGEVRAAPGFADALKAYGQGGWSGLAAAPEHGGQGLPRAVEQAANEMMHAANMAFGLCPMLTLGAIEAIAAHASPDLQAIYLPPMVAGTWTGAMNLTESAAGSDLAAVRTTATPTADGAYLLNGQKIFITWGDHDAAENIVHLVLARIPGAPEGVKGISLFLAPKFIPTPHGAIGERNGVRVAGLEHKLGIHASPTCVMAFEDALAWRVGEENRGLAHMFTMMNAARLGVGVQGVAIAERAYQQAFNFAHERRQGRPVLAAKGDGPIADHPDVRVNLLVMKAKIEAARALCLLTAVEGDLAHAAPNAADREAARLRQDFLVPIAKAWSTDRGVEIASMAVQIHGGMGFIEETGAAQHYRDARIAPIYEGTNGIQAIDLIGRKLGQADGEAAQSLLAEADQIAKALASHPDPRLQAAAPFLISALDAAVQATQWIEAAKLRSLPDALTGATAYLTLMGETLGGALIAKGALAGLASETDPAQRDARIRSLTVYAAHVLAKTPGLRAAIELGAPALGV